MDLTFGGITFIVGLILAFKIRTSITSGLQPLAWMEFGLTVLLLAIGIRSITKGSSRVFRFLVGRNIPSDLAPNPYRNDEIEESLKKRSNPTFEESDDYFSRLLISLFDKFLFLPPRYQDIFRNVSASLFSFLLFLAIYLLVIFTTSIGLIRLTDKASIISLFTFFFMFLQFIVWFKNRPTIKRTSSSRKRRAAKRKQKSVSTLRIVSSIILAIFVPFGLEILARGGTPLPEIRTNAFIPVAVLLILSSSVVAITYLLSLSRMANLNPDTKVSDFKTHLQAEVHPKDLFRCFETEMEDKRFKELPNRVYREVKPVLTLEGSQNKGSFYGSTIQETQPVNLGESLPKTGQLVRSIAAIFGRVLHLAGLLFLVYSIEKIGNNFTVTDIDPSMVTTTINAIIYPIMFSVFAAYFNRIAHIFYSEMLFQSYLVHFFTEGTYSESKVSTGMSIYDSTRSENTVNNTSATPWILASHITTSTFTDSSVRNLEGTRHILEMRKADDFVDDLINGFSNYLNNMNNIAGLNNQTVEKAKQFNKLNEATHSKRINEQSTDKPDQIDKGNSEHGAARRELED